MSGRAVDLLWQAIAESLGEELSAREARERFGEAWTRNALAAGLWSSRSVLVGDTIPCLRDRPDCAAVVCQHRAAFIATCGSDALACTVKGLAEDALERIRIDATPLAAAVARSFGLAAPTRWDPLDALMLGSRTFGDRNTVFVLVKELLEANQWQQVTALRAGWRADDVVAIVVGGVLPAAAPAPPPIVVPLATIAWLDDGGLSIDPGDLKRRLEPRPKLVLDPAARSASLAGTRIEFRGKAQQADLFFLLAEHPERFVTVREIAHRLWPGDVSARTGAVFDMLGVEHRLRQALSKLRPLLPAGLTIVRARGSEGQPGELRLAVGDAALEWVKPKNGSRP